jgi:hypothetical protein
MSHAGPAKEVPQLPSSCKGKPILHHFHVAKTGGTAVQKILRRESAHSRNWCLRSTEARYSRISPANYTRSLLLLREPFEWLFSAIYHDHEKGRIPSPEGVFRLRDALNHSLHSKDVMGNKGYNYINYQTRWLVDNESDELAAVEKAKEATDHMDIVGDPSFMRETVCLSLYIMRSSSFKKCDCGFLPPATNVRVNPNKKNKHVEMLVDYPTIFELSRVMRADIDLYAYAHARFMRDVHHVEEETGQRFHCPSR